MRMTWLVFSVALSLAGGVVAQQHDGALADPPASEIEDAFDTALDANSFDESALDASIEPDAPAEAAPPASADPPFAAELTDAAAPGESAGDPIAIRNADVAEMHAAGFGASTIIAAIEANATDFDVTPRALLALKRVGVADIVIEAMIAAKQRATAQASAAVESPPAEERAAAAAPSARASAGLEPASADAMSPEALAQLSRMIEQLAAAPPPPATEPSEPIAPEPQTENPHAPRAWVMDGERKVPIAPTVAQVAYTDMKRPAATAFKTLQSFGAKALAFANPVFGTAASGLGELFQKDDDDATAVWALLGSTSTRALAAGTVFEIDFANVPGVNPDRYRPAIVQLVPTSDNFRLVGAAKSEGGQAGAPSGSIIEEPAAADLIQLGRGRYRVALGGTVPPGEYALVLRPIEQSARERRRGNDSSLGALMGASATTQVIYLTWDFSIRS